MVTYIKVKSDNQNHYHHIKLNILSSYVRWNVPVKHIFLCARYSTNFLITAVKITDTKLSFIIMRHGDSKYQYLWYTTLWSFPYSAVFISRHILDILVDVLAGMYSADSTEVFYRTGPVRIRNLNMVNNVLWNDMVPSGVRPSAYTVMTIEFNTI